MLAQCTLYDSTHLQQHASKSTLWTRRGNDGFESCAASRSGYNVYPQITIAFYNLVESFLCSARFASTVLKNTRMELTALRPPLLLQGTCDRRKKKGPAKSAASNSCECFAANRNLVIKRRCKFLKNYKNSAVIIAPALSS